MHVDDLLVTADDGKLIDWLHKKLVEKYKEVTYERFNRIRYLGININRVDKHNIELDCC